MSVDLNTADEQGSGAGAIPEDSVVMVTMEIRPPKAGKEGTANPLFCASDSGYEYLDVELAVVNGRKIWQNFMLHYTKAQTEKSQMAISISMRFLRAAVESCRKISPKDSSPAAIKARIINDFSDLNGMMFPIVVGCEWSKPNRDGKRYLNNTIKRVVTSDDEKYQKIWSSDEGMILSDKPLPPEPAASAPAGAKPAWAGKPAAAEPAKTEPLPGVTATAKPSWVK